MNYFKYFSCYALNLELTTIKYLKSFFSFKKTITARKTVTKKQNISDSYSMNMTGPPRKKSECFASIFNIFQKY